MADETWVSAEEVPAEPEETPTVDHVSEEDARDHLVDDGMSPLDAYNRTIVEHSRKVLEEEAKHLDYTDGPADNVTGDTASSEADRHSRDPYARHIPLGPDNPFLGDDK